MKYGPRSPMGRLEQELRDLVSRGVLAAEAAHRGDTTSRDYHLDSAKRRQRAILERIRRATKAGPNGRKRRAAA